MNFFFEKREPWQIAALSSMSTIFVVWMYQFLTKDESKPTLHYGDKVLKLCEISGVAFRAKKQFFKYVRYVPSVRNKIEKELQSIQNTFEEDMAKHGDNIGYIVKLPDERMTRRDILAKVDEYLELGHYKWQEGFVSGAVYNSDIKVSELMTKVFSKTSYTNPLHADVFPGSKF